MQADDISLLWVFAKRCRCAAAVCSCSLPGNRVVPVHFGPPPHPGCPWVPLGMQRILYGFGLNCVRLPGSYTANVYGQVSCDYTCSQSQGMVLNDLRKSQYFDSRTPRIPRITRNFAYAVA